MKHEYIKTKLGWHKIINESNNFYVLNKVGGVIEKKYVIDTIETNQEPIDMLITLLKKGVNITEEISGNGYEQYLKKVENHSEEYVLTKKEFEGIKDLHSRLIFGENYYDLGGN